MIYSLDFITSFEGFSKNCLFHELPQNIQEVKVYIALPEWTIYEGWKMYISDVVYNNSSGWVSHYQGIFPDSNL